MFERTVVMFSTRYLVVEGKLKVASVQIQVG
jgi:hypothetical protein